LELRAPEEFRPRSIYHAQDWFTAFFCRLTKCPAGQEALTAEKRQRTKIQRIITPADFENFFKREKNKTLLKNFTFYGATQKRCQICIIH